LKILILIFFFLLSLPSAWAYDWRDSTDKTIFEEYIETLSVAEFIKNKPTLELSYGYSQPSLSKTRYPDNFTPTFDLDFRYGFNRTTFRQLPGNMIYVAGEYLLIGNNSYFMKPAFVELKGNPTDAWRFGLGYANGYGYQFGENSRLVFYHGGNLLWNKVNIEFDSPEDDKYDYLSKFDETSRFGHSFEVGVKYQFMSVVHLKAGYEHAIFFPGYNFPKWIGSFGPELVIQRIIDFVALRRADANPKNFPLLVTAIKGVVSFALYEFRRNQAYWPYKSDQPLNYDTFKIGMSFVFDASVNSD
jgi:opacity protein-like surface antigen